MPNDCINRVTIYADTPTIKTIRDASGALLTLIHHISVAHECRIYNYNLHCVGKEGIIFSITSAWTPINELLEALMEEYMIYFIKNEWSVEDGSTGVWIAEPAKARGARPVLRQLHWDEGCIEAKNDVFQPLED